MAFVLYQGEKIGIPDDVKVDVLADTILAVQNSGSYKYLNWTLEGEVPKRIRIVVGPGIPVGIISDPLDGHDGNVTDEDLKDFLSKSE